MKMVERRNWEEFRATGLNWWTNRALHLFGWAIVFDYDNIENPNEELQELGKMLSATTIEDKERLDSIIQRLRLIHEGCNIYPARVKFRGFDNKIEEKGFIKISKYLQDNIEALNIDLAITHKNAPVVIEGGELPEFIGNKKQ